MMWDFEPPRILVAVEKDDSGAALAYAAREARTRRCGVHVVHVVPVVAGGRTAPETLAMINGELHDRGRRITGDAAAALTRLIEDDDLPISTEICRGPVVPTLVQRSEHAVLVVLQHRGMGPDGLVPGLSVTTGVTGYARAPVVAVPDEWTVPEAGAGSVTVLLGGEEDNARLVETAAEEAVRLGTGLTLVHQESAAELMARVPDTALFVVGRRRLPSGSGGHLDQLAHTLLRRSPVPVMVVDYDGDSDDPRQQRERAAAVTP